MKGHKGRRLQKEDGGEKKTTPFDIVYFVSGEKECWSKVKLSLTPGIINPDIHKSKQDIA